MRTYVFVENTAPAARAALCAMAEQVIEKVAQTTDTSRLVLALYLLEDSDVWGGYLVAHGMLNRDGFVKHYRHWSFVTRFPVPEDLPDSFALIRVAIGSRWKRKMTLRDRYGCTLKFGSLEDHLAFIFAHELHHFRRYHLNMHAKEGELSADKWALLRMAELGYRAELVGRKRRRAKKKAAAKRIPSKQNPKLLQRMKHAASHLCPADLMALVSWARERAPQLEHLHKRRLREEAFEALRALPEGTGLEIIRDTTGPCLVGRLVTKVRNLKRNSCRMVVRDQAGEEWLWPMAWLRRPVNTRPAEKRE